MRANKLQSPSEISFEPPFFYSLPLLAAVLLLSAAAVSVSAQIIPGDQEFLRQQERERVLRERHEAAPSVQFERPVKQTGLLPADEQPCSQINRIVLQGDTKNQFQWALSAADAENDPATGRCLGAKGIATVIGRIQNAILERGYVTTRVLAAPQDISPGSLLLTLIPGRIRNIRFAENTPTRATLWNAMPAQPGDVLNLREIEQALENFKRVPSADADIKIMPTSAADAQPGDSDVVIHWNQGLPFRLNLSIDDAGNKATGKYQAAVTLSYDNWLTLNDLFYVSFNQDAGGGLPGKRGTHGYTVHYSLPFRHWLFSATTSSYDYHQSVAGLNQTVEYSGESSNSELRIARVLYRDSKRSTSTSLRLWMRESANFIEGAELIDQRRRTSGWELGLSHRESIAGASLSTNLAYRRGTGALKALRAAEDAFGEGSSRMQVVTADALLALPFAIAAQRLRYSAGWRAQWNRTPLVIQDQFAIGSRYTVRGFDGQLLLTGDRGWLIRQELAAALADTGAEIFAGIDAGEIGGQASAAMAGTRLAGAVLGLRGSAAHVNWEAFVGTPVSKPENYRASKTVTGFNLNLSF